MTKRELIEALEALDTDELSIYVQDYGWCVIDKVCIDEVDKCQITLSFEGYYG